MDSITGYHIHRYVALSVIGHRMCNRISGLCDKSSITIDTKRYRETSLVCCLRYYYSCCALVIIRGNQLVIFPGIALYYGNTSILLHGVECNMVRYCTSGLLYFTSQRRVKYSPQVQCLTILHSTPCNDKFIIIILISYLAISSSDTCMG